MKRNVEAIVYFVWVDAYHHIFSVSYGRVQMRFNCDKLKLERYLSQLVNAIIVKLDAILRVISVTFALPFADKEIFGKQFLFIFPMQYT